MDFVFKFNDLIYVYVNMVSFILLTLYSLFLCQTRCRQYLARLHFTRMKKAAIAIQCAWRGKIARKELRKLKLVLFVFAISSKILLENFLYHDLKLILCRRQERRVRSKLQRINWKSKLKNSLGDFNWRREWGYLEIISSITFVPLIF